MRPVPINPHHPLAKYLWRISALADANERVAATVRAYTEATGIHPANPLTDADRRQIRDWLIQEERNALTNEDGHAAALLVGERTPIGIPRIHADLARKTGWLQQAPCITCLPATDVTPLDISLPIRTRPFSAQSMDAPKLASLKQKITQYLASGNHDLSAWGAMNYASPLWRSSLERSGGKTSTTWLKDCSMPCRGLYIQTTAWCSI